jgi:poly(3-hydroxybutyrate) depolymerase
MCIAGWIMCLNCAVLGTVEAQEVVIQSSKDGATQHAIFWSPRQTDAAQPAPLLVALHSWQGTYKQDNGLLAAAQQRGWVVILPDFRGPNVRSQACASDLAVQDVLDAVEYAAQHARIDRRRIYLVGGSGGGHMALMMVARAPQVWAGVSAWVPIVDLAAWHAESLVRSGKYATLLEQVCGGKPGTAETDKQYHARSPIFFLAAAKECAVDINVGIHDGHTGSVPVSHTLRAFNILAEANGCPDKMLTPSQITFMTEQQKVPAELDAEKSAEPGRAKPILFRRSAGSVRVTVFDGGHELDAPAACDWLAKQQQP